MAHYQQTNQLALLSEHPLVIIRDSADNPLPGKCGAAHQLEAKVHVSKGWERGGVTKSQTEFCLWIMHITSNAYTQLHK